MEKIIDIRSDTLTKPTEEMYRAMREAELGDEQAGEDPTVNKLQEMAAEKLGKEAGLFVTSGTMGNLVALLTHTNPGDSVILEAESHTYRCEGGGISALGGAMPKRVAGKLGVPSPEDIEKAVIGEGNLFATTTLISLENTHNAAGGTCISAEQMNPIKRVADKHGLQIHVDGARIFNAAVALKTDTGKLVKAADSVQFCLSKGLCCPFGSLLVGNRDFIKRAMKKRQMVGGGMRQAGVIAAAGIVALNHMIDRLEEDHEKAKIMAEGLQELGLYIDIETVQTNMVFFNVPSSIMEPVELVQKLRDNNVRIGPPKKNRIRVVMHKDISKKDVKHALKIFQAVIKENH